MNNFRIVVKNYTTHTQATEQVNEFIDECNKEGVEILDITTHYAAQDTEIGTDRGYVFIFKLRELK